MCNFTKFLFKKYKLFFEQSQSQKTREIKGINFTEFLFGIFHFMKVKCNFYGKYSKKNNRECRWGMKHDVQFHEIFFLKKNNLFFSGFK